MAGIAVLLLMAVLLTEGQADTSIPRVNCLIINLEYIDCTWISQGIQEVNYTFHHRREKRSYRECATYLLQNGLTVGCRLPYTRALKFHKLHTRLFMDNSSSEQIINLTHEVKLNPPHHLLLEEKEDEGNAELWLRWNVSCPSRCVESEVRYSKPGSTLWKITVPMIGYSFTLPFFSPEDMYEFQVRIRVPDDCAQSKYWSDWSAPVVWGPKLQPNSAGYRPWRPVSAVFWSGLAAVVLAQTG
ncbi:cytokine receptor common subunit gamma-like isoform X2 [Conger conger]|uniref:cytokine receptor common subunit gamma-like isoform X2 n=1 Tax=Conger conger TaxID=82655 RepID=UPI002A59E8EE|nr:cytokine receptor common subunit gamma-like isoform X2 [Conger conger]